MKELAGNQDKIDANNDGKISSEDFKILRLKKQVGNQIIAIKMVLKMVLLKLQNGSIKIKIYILM